jgi:hypothetical protein
VKEQFRTQRPTNRLASGAMNPITKATPLRIKVEATVQKGGPAGQGLPPAAKEREPLSLANSCHRVATNCGTRQSASYS